MELILVRHGTALGNLERRFVGVTDAPLTAEGENLATRRANLIPEVEHVFVSPLRRCLRTAEIVWPHSEQTVIDGLRETDFGRFEYKCHEEVKDDPDYQAWLESGGKQGLVGTESTDECILRIESAIQKITEICKAKKFSKVGVVTHGGTIMNMLWAFGRPQRDYYDWTTPNCGGWIVSIGEERLKLIVEKPLEEI